MNITISDIKFYDKKKDGTEYRDKSGNKFSRILIKAPELEGRGHAQAICFGYEGSPSLSWQVGQTVEVSLEESKNPQYPDPTIKPMTKNAKAEESTKELEKRVKALEVSIGNLASNLWAKLSDLEYMTNRHEDLIGKKDAVSTVEVKETQTTSSTPPTAPEVKPWHKPIPSQKAAQETFDGFEG